jgi:16S rRNA (uracil1498-N3)-methyltransferase
VNLLLLDDHELVDGHAVLADRRAQHLRRVLGIEPGQVLRAGVVGGAVGDAEVITVDDAAVRVRFTARGAAPPPLPLDLVLAVPRPKVLSRVVQTVAAIGIRRLDLVNAWRVDKSYLGSARLDEARLREDLRLGAEQGETTHLPAVALHPRLMTFLDARYPPEAPAAASADAGHRLIAHARGGVDVEVALPPGSTGGVALAIGPEGGWIDREVDTFAARGFAVVRLGAPILRVEAAVTAALAQVALLQRLP